MKTFKLIKQLNRAGIAWCPIGDGPKTIPAVMIRHWDAMKEQWPPKIPSPFRGEYYAAWPDCPFPDNIDPEDWVAI